MADANAIYRRVCQKAWKTDELGDGFLDVYTKNLTGKDLLEAKSRIMAACIIAEAISNLIDNV